MKYWNISFLIIGILLAVLYVLDSNELTLASSSATGILNPFSGSGGEIKTKVRIKNPNLLSCTIKSIHEKFFMNNVLIGIVDNNINQGIPGMKDSEFPISIRYKNEDFQLAMSSAPALGQAQPIVVKGEIEYQSLFKSGTIHVDQSVYLSHP